MQHRGLPGGSTRMSGPPRLAPVATTPFEAAVGARIDGLANWYHRLVPPLLLGVVMLFDSWDAVVLAQTMPALVREWHVGPVLIGTMISIGYGGQFLGAFAFGPLAERYGRLPVLQAALALMSVLAILCALAPGYPVLMALRFFQGLAIGGALPIAITYINELAPAPIRGRYFAIFQFLTMSGYTVASLVGILVIPHFGWRWMFAIGATPLLLLPVIAAALPESPRWLARRGRVDDANRALGRLGGAAVVSTSDPVAALGERVAIPHERVSPLELFSPDYRRQTLTLLPLWLLSSIVVFGTANWAPTIYTTIYHVTHATALRYIATAGFCYLGLVLLMGLLIDRLGRRGLALACCCVAVVALLTLAAFDPRTLPIPAVLLHMGSVSLSVMVSVMLWPYTAETFPTRIRATALGFFSSMNRLPPMFVPILIGGVIHVTGSIRLVFALFFVCAAITLLVWMFFTRETAGRSLEEIGNAENQDNQENR
jgi:putative MFS transporter